MDTQDQTDTKAERERSNSDDRKGSADPYLPHWMRFGQHVQLYRGHKDDIVELGCGHVVGLYPLGISLRPCDGHDEHRFYLWTAIQEIWPVGPED